MKQEVRIVRIQATFQEAAQDAGLHAAPYSTLRKRDDARDRAAGKRDRSIHGRDGLTRRRAWRQTAWLAGAAATQKLNNLV